MKRNEFFKQIGLGIAAMVVAPKVFAKTLEEIKDAPTGNVAEPWKVEHSYGRKRINHNNDLGIYCDHNKSIVLTKPITVLQLHKQLQDWADESVPGSILSITAANPSIRRTDHIIELLHGFHVKEFSMEYLRGGSLTQTVDGKEEIWSIHEYKGYYVKG